MTSFFGFLLHERNCSWTKQYITCLLNVVIVILLLWEQKENKIIIFLCVALLYIVFVMQRGRVEAEFITHKYCNSSTKPKFYKNTRLIGKIIEKTSLTNFYSKTHININNLSIKSIYRNIIYHTPFRKRNNKSTSTWERKNNLTRKRKTIKIPIQLGKIF